MNCLQCKTKLCRAGTACGAESFTAGSMGQKYHDLHSQRIVQAAAQLVDNGRAGTLSRLQETIEFIKIMEYKKVGLAYCYGMEKQADAVFQKIKEAIPSVIGISCTVGALGQHQVNKKSSITNVSCNPLSQAEQLNNEGVDFVIVMGLCLGHDILFQKHIQADCTTLVVKDRVYNHCPLEALRN